MNDDKLELIGKFFNYPVDGKTDCKICIFIDVNDNTVCIYDRAENLPNALANIMEQSKVLKDLFYDVYSHDIEVNLKIDDLIK